MTTPNTAEIRQKLNIGFDVHYETFELLIGARQQDGYPITILQSLAGEENAFCRLDPENDGNIERRLERISDHDTDQEYLKEFGSYLFKHIFFDKIEALFRKHIGMMEGQQKYLRLRLRIEAPELAALPWEYLYDKQSDTFFATDSKKALVRYIPMGSSKRRTLVTPPLRVLVVISNPKDYPQLDVEQEKKMIEEALEKLKTEKKIKLQFLDKVLIGNINQAMRDFSPHIFHFIGHATFEDEKGEVILQDENGDGKSIDQDTFSKFFQNAPDTRVAVFNACQTAAISSSDLLSGLAPVVLKHELSAVVGMQYAISDQAAKIFSREFYGSLAVGYPLEVAISEARKGIFMEIGQGESDWGNPVLFLRSEDGQLLEREKNRSLKAPLQLLPRVKHFTGRETELAQLLKALQPSEVVTLCGPGGIGKTALAAEAIWTLAPYNSPPDIFPDGIIYHNFYHHPQATLALEAITRAFTHEPIQGPPAIAAQRVLAGRQALLVFDGAEKADDLQAVLAVRGRCGVLITTRDRKQASGGQQDIPPLPDNEAVSLLQAWGKKRAKDEESVREICELVGGLPLAVCLVGRYLDWGSQKAVDYLKWLQKTPLKALNQGQRQLESVPVLLDKSLQQVSEEAREALAVVGLLGLAPFSLEIVAHVLEMEPFEVGPLLAELVRYGLLVRRNDPYEVSHALIHTYARERLAGAIERDAETKQRLSDYYFELARNAIPSEEGSFPVIDQAHPHILKALEIAKEQHDEKGDSARRLMIEFVEQVDKYWQVHNQYQVQVRWLKEAYECAEALGQSIPQASFAQRIGRAFSELGDLEQGLRWLAEGEKDLKDIESREANSIRALIYIHRASALYLQNNLSEAKNNCISGLNLADEHRQGASLAEACNLLGSIYFVLGESENAIKFMKKGLCIWEKLGNEYQAMRVQSNMGTPYLYLGELDKARQAFQNAQKYWHNFPNPSKEVIMLTNLSVTSCMLGKCKAMAGFPEDFVIKHYQAAKNDSNQSLSISKQLNIKRLFIVSLKALAWSQLCLGKLEEAKANLKQSLEIQHGSGMKIYLADTYHILAEVALEEQLYNKAMTLVKKALIEIGSQRDESEKGAAHRVLAKAYRLSGKLDKAKQFLNTSLTELQAITNPFETALTKRELALLYQEQGRLEEAKKTEAEVQAILIEMGIRR